MRNAIRIGAAAAALAAMGASSAEAAAIYIWNKTSRPVWITVYDTYKAALNTGCIAAGTVSRPVGFSSAGDRIAFGGSAYIRFEYKSGTDCSGKTYYDTHYGPAYGTSGNKDINVYIPPSPVSIP